MPVAATSGQFAVASGPGTGAYIARTLVAADIPAANAVGALTNDGAGNLSYTNKVGGQEAEDIAGLARRSYSNGLLKFRAALAAGTPAAIAILGDSITQGAGAVNNDGSWANQSIAKLVSKYGGTAARFQNIITGGQGTYTGTWTSVPGVGPSQTGSAAYDELRSASSSATVTMGGVCTTVDIYYYTYADSAAFTVTVDGVSQGSFGGTTTSSYTPGVVTITGLTNYANHSVVLTAPASGKVYFLGMSFRYDAGLNALNFAQAGSRIECIQQPDNVSFLSVIPNLKLIVCAMGANDGSSSGPTYSAKYAALIAQAKAIGVPILFVLTEQASTLADADKAAIDQTIKDMAFANGYEWLSVYDRWGSYTAANAVGLYADTIHPSQAGHNDISEMFTRYLLDYTGGNLNSYGFSPYLYAPNGTTIDLGPASQNSQLVVTGGYTQGQGIIVKNTKNGGIASLVLQGDGSVNLASNSTQLKLTSTNGSINMWNAKVGINNTTPATTLDVTGSIRASTTLTSGSASQFNVDTNGNITAPTITAPTVTVSSALSITAPENLTLGAGWLNYTPTITAGGSMTVSGVTIMDAQYCRLGPIIFFKVYASFSLGGTAHSAVFVTLPVAQVGTLQPIDGYMAPFGAGWQTGFSFVNGATAEVDHNQQTSFPLGATSIMIGGAYRVI
jgi:lysophospholipase L1-like esterase